MLSALFPCAVGALVDSPLLFIDRSLFSSFDERLLLRVHQPQKGPRVIKPTEKWESWAIFAYNHVMQVEGEGHRMYYDCIEGTGLPPGQNERSFFASKATLSHRRICLATSTDGLTWAKPSLGIFNYNGSTANNILIEDSGVSVFIDDTPGVPPAQKWKMVCSTSAYASPDGLRWTKLGKVKCDVDDTKPTAYVNRNPSDKSKGKYTVVVRRDVAVPGKSSDVVRQMGRCVTDDLTDWLSVTPHCPSILSLDDQDPDHLDIYTNAWTPYPSPSNPVVHLFFPSFYHHFGKAAPYGFGNDGLLDIRLAVSRDSKNVSYVPASNGRAPFIPLGINTCVGDPSTNNNASASPSVRGGWCSPASGEEAHATAFDTSAMYMASGYVPSNDGTSLYLYSSGQPFTHGGDGSKKLWGNNTGIRVNTMRKDGFVSVDAPYYFPSARASLPSFTTIPITVPPASACPPAHYSNTSTDIETGCAYEFSDGQCDAPYSTVKCQTTADCHTIAHNDHLTCTGVPVICMEGVCKAPAVKSGDLCVAKKSRQSVWGGIQLHLNVETSVAGFVVVGVAEVGTADSAATPPLNYSVANSDPVRGNAVSAVASWGGEITSLSSFAGKQVQFTVAMADAKLFAMRLVCSSE